MSGSALRSTTPESVIVRRGRGKKIKKLTTLVLKGLEKEIAAVYPE